MNAPKCHLCSYVVGCDDMREAKETAQDCNLEVYDLVTGILRMHFAEAHPEECEQLTKQLTETYGSSS